ncbi:hypothetical protein FQZ97_877230 [compost metagenome]
MRVALRHEFVAGREGMRHGRCSGCRLRHRLPALDDEAAADREVGAFGQHGAVGCEGGEAHRVRVLGQRFLAAKGDVAHAVEGDGRGAQQAQLAGAAQRVQARLHGLGSHGVGRVAEEAQDHALVGRVAVAGGAERAEQVDVQARHLREQAAPFERLREQQRGAHRPDGVRTGRADADLEDVEGGEHQRIMRPEAAV